MKSSRAALVLAAVWALGGCASEEIMEGTEVDDPGVTGEGQDPAPFGYGSKTALTLFVDGGRVELDWLVPAATESVALVRRFGRPVVGAPGALATGEEILFAGRSLTYSDGRALPGSIHYALFTREDGTSPYVAVADAVASVPLSAQTGEIVVSLASAADLLVSAQPANITLAGSATWDFDASQLTVKLDLTNATARELHNPHVRVTSNQGELIEDAHGGGSPFDSGIEMGATATRTLVFDGVTGDIDPIVLSVELMDGPGNGTTND